MMDLDNITSSSTTVLACAPQPVPVSASTGTPVGLGTTFIVSSKDNGTKLFAYCKSNCVSVSKKQLKHIFSINGIFINNIQIDNGSSAECIRVQTGDQIHICHDLSTSATSTKSVGFSQLNKIISIGRGDEVKLITKFENDYVCVIEKPAGVNAVANGDFDVAVQNYLAHSNGGESGEMGGGVVLYRLPKYMSGLIVAVKNQHSSTSGSMSLQQQMVMQSFITGDMTFVFTCVVTGYLGTAGSVRTMSVPASQEAADDLADSPSSPSPPAVVSVFSEYVITVLQVTECRFSDFISLIEIRPRVNGTTTATAATTAAAMKCHVKTVRDDLAGKEILPPHKRSRTIPMSTAITSTVASTTNKAFTPASASVSAPAPAPSVSALSLTAAIKRLKVDLSSLCLRVVGDGDVVKSGKGVFIVLNRIEIGNRCDGNAGNGGNSDERKLLWTGVEASEASEASTRCLAAAPIPTKFHNLMTREHELYQQAIVKAGNLVDSWLALHRSNVQRTVQLRRMMSLVQEVQESVPPAIVPTVVSQAAVGLGRDTNPLGEEIVMEPKAETVETAGTTGTAGVGTRECVRALALLLSESETKSVTVSDFDFKTHCCRIHIQYSIPVEYLLGEVSFCGSRYTVTPDVMIPRRSSECLVEAVLSEVATWGENSQALSQGLSVLDMGTGSGCLLLSVIRGLLTSSNNSKSADVTPTTETSTLTAVPTTTTTADEVTPAPSSAVVGMAVPTLRLAVGIDLSPAALKVASGNVDRLIAELEKKQEQREKEMTGQISLSSHLRIQLLHGRFSELSTLTSSKLSHLRNTTIANRSDGADADPSSHYCYYWSNIVTGDSVPVAAVVVPSVDTVTSPTTTGFDVIMCNPPYSTVHDKSRISRQSLKMEPALALLTDNMYDAYKEIANAFNRISIRIGRPRSVSDCNVDNNSNDAPNGALDNNDNDNDNDAIFSGGRNAVIGSVNVNNSDASYVYADKIVHSGTIVVLEIGAGQHDAVREIFQTTVPSIVFVKYILDYNQLIRGLMFKFV